MVNSLSANPEAYSETRLALLRERFRADGLKLQRIDEPSVLSGLPCDDMLDVRMLFSALVDADFIETEAHFAGTADQPRIYRGEGPALNPAKALTALETYLHTLPRQSSSQMQQMRDALRQHCLEAAERPTGLFTLSAPTGSGKTLAMLSFALRHAQRHNLRRVVLVMPFLNIIDQTVGKYRQIFSSEAGFPEHYVLEDHSLAGSPNEGEDESADSADPGRQVRRLLAENWDAPIVLTTNVKCLESLMANRPGACRKLHRLARSVIMFDEVQTFPAELATATLATLSRLSQRFASSVLFATATQPAFEQLDSAVAKFAVGSWRPTEVVPPESMARMFGESARRTAVSWEIDSPLTLEQLADRLLAEPSGQALCIVNLRRHAARLAELIAATGRRQHVLHLSTSMCPLHRERVIDEVKRRLDPACREPVILVSTQCVEAGVDLDFPVVYRALAPLEAIAQAAGRCNRHGVRPAVGKVVVFQLAPDGEALYPPGYGRALGVTEGFLKQRLAAGAQPIHEPAELNEYFARLYDLSGVGKASEKKERELRDALCEASFAKVAQRYRLIDNDALNLLTPYDKPTFQRLRDEILNLSPRTPEGIRDWIRRARPHTVSVYRSVNKPHLLRSCIHAIPFNKSQEESDRECDWFYALEGLEYDPMLGLRPPQGDMIM